MRRTAPPVHPFGTLTIPREHVEVLPNGITLHYVSGGDQPTCRMSLFFEGGMYEFGNDITGRIVLSSLTEGTDRLSPDELADILDYNGVQIGPGSHGHYSSLKVAMLNHRVDDVVPLIGEMLARPLLPADRLETLRVRCKVRLKTEAEELSMIANRAFAEIIMGKEHPMAKQTSEAEVDRHTVEYVRAVYRQLLCPAKMHVFLAGLLDKRIIDTVKNFLNNIPATGNGFDSKIIPYTPMPAGTLKTVEKADSYQSCIMSGIPTITRENPDYIPLRLAIMALGGYFGSRLMANIREEKGLTYGISSLLVGSKEGSYMLIQAKCDKKYTETVMNEISAELENLKKNPPQGKELERLKLYASTTLAEILDTPHSILGYYSSQLLVATPDNYFEKQLAAINSLTPDIISEMATKYIEPSQLRTAIAGA